MKILTACRRVFHRGRVLQVHASVNEDHSPLAAVVGDNCLTLEEDYYEELRKHQLQLAVHVVQRLKRIIQSVKLQVINCYLHLLDMYINKKTLNENSSLYR